MAAKKLSFEEKLSKGPDGAPVELPFESTED